MYNRTGFAPRCQALAQMFQYPNTSNSNCSNLLSPSLFRGVSINPAVLNSLSTRADEGSAMCNPRIAIPFFLRVESIVVRREGRVTGLYGLNVMTSLIFAFVLACTVHIERFWKKKDFLILNSVNRRRNDFKSKSKSFILKWFTFKIKIKINDFKSDLKYIDLKSFPTLHAFAYLKTSRIRPKTRQSKHLFRFNFVVSECLIGRKDTEMGIQLLTSYVTNVTWWDLGIMTEKSVWFLFTIFNER